MNHIYILYRITNKVNKNFYIGVHKTKDIHDNYWGSGHAIKAAIQKYGLENFKKEIIQVFSNKKNAYNEESKIVNENMLKNKKCYNLKEGGCGGFEHIYKQNKHKYNKGKKVIYNIKTNKIKWVDVSQIDLFLLKGWKKGHSPDVKRKMSISGKLKIQSKEARLKNSNSKKNSVVMENGETHIRKYINKNDVDYYIKMGWFVYDKMKNFRNKKLIHNIKTKETKRINKNQIKKMLSLGWSLGQLSKC